VTAFCNKIFSVIDFLKGYEGQLSNDGCPQGLEMIYRTENQIKMELGLNAWRNLLQDKVVRFAHMMQEMDINVMMKLAGELPQLRDFARLTLQRLDASTTAAISGGGLAAALIALDYIEITEKDQSKDKLRLLESLLLQLKECQDLLTFDEQFVRGLAKRNQDSLRHYIIFMLVYTGGCFYPIEQEID